MSRCFPFPPPGYDKKTRAEDTDFLAKEKQKEKKHKKEKKDKARKEGKEKRERSKEKHKDRKDRKEKHKEREKSRDVEKERSSDLKGPRNGEKVDASTSQFAESKDSKHVQELAKRIRDNDGVSRSQPAENLAEKPPRNPVVQAASAASDGRGRMHATASENSVKEKTEMSRKEGFSKPNGKENNGARSGEKPSASLQVEGKEKTAFHQREGVIDKRKHSDRDRDKDKRSKERKTDEMCREQNKTKEIANSALDFRNTKLPNSPIVCNPSVAVESSLGKRKEPERNGYTVDEAIRLKKAAKSLSDHSSSIKIEKKEQAEDHVLSNNHVAGTKEVKLNGFISPHRRSEPPARPSPSPAAASENGESCKPKPAHPDSVILSQILCMQVMEDLPESLDQEWLLSSNKKRRAPDSSAGDDIKEVWSEAVRIESADISALPYVIPY